MLMFFGRGIDWWHFLKFLTNRVARFLTAGLPDYEILAYCNERMARSVYTYFFGQGIDWWHCQKSPTSKVARFHTVGLPDYEILAYFAKLKPSKGLEICIHIFFGWGIDWWHFWKSSMSRVVRFRTAGLQAMKFELILPY